MNHDWIEIAQGIGAYAGIVGIYFIWRQIKQTNKNLKQSNHAAMYSLNSEIYRVFIDYPKLRPFFLKGKELGRKKKTRNRVFSLAELLADHFEYVLLEKDLRSENIYEPWSNYMINIYTKSSAFREFMKKNQHLYSKELRTFFAKVLV